ncbi:hypothetical protein WS86_30730 [Burkholderia savannae]|nr:hypothetical protein WS78_28735 [Burkholderia savannae]KVG45091.1 hypothetical protein WS77_08010 [Burkholderia sp. MSMB0265]KVG90081.1 hypothetical protein WS81_20240 [Burkholderia sp. MSMB2040]KVG96220.1 hypothetical protein WS82_03420 [Burkholderia sp. MSMB2041]AOJ84862.1 hypothetical protein WS86_30730 [Burkholderia savannae]
MVKRCGSGDRRRLPFVTHCKSRERNSVACASAYLEKIRHAPTGENAMRRACAHIQTPESNDRPD